MRTENYNENYINILFHIKIHKTLDKRNSFHPRSEKILIKSVFSVKRKKLLSGDHQGDIKKTDPDFCTRMKKRIDTKIFLIGYRQGLSL